MTYISLTYSWKRLLPTPRKMKMIWQSVRPPGSVVEKTKVPHRLQCGTLILKQNTYYAFGKPISETKLQVMFFVAYDFYQPAH
jgi:hypothetical protein